jgi:hypothetical protein
MSQQPQSETSGTSGVDGGTNDGRKSLHDGHRTPESLSVSGVDLSGYVSGLDWGRTEPDANANTRWGDYLAGLEPATLSLTLDNRDSRFTPFAEALFPAAPPTYRVSYEVPDGRWQRIRHWLKRHGLRWLKVRYVTYSFDAEFQAREIHDQDGTGFAMDGHAVGTLTKGLTER